MERARFLRRASWWERILAGDTTAIPPEWEAGDGKIKMAGESAREFLAILEREGIEPSPKLMEAAKEFVARETIRRSGTHPNGMEREEFEELYDE